MPTDCFIIRRTDRVRLTLRRFTYSAQGACPSDPTRGHDASALLERDAPGRYREDGVLLAYALEHADPRWQQVATCACGYPFQDTDNWQVFPVSWYEDEIGSRYTTRWREKDAAPPGAMWEAPWFADTWSGPDGTCWTVRLPSGEDWVIDGPSTSGGFWTRTGEAPNLSVTPSIAARRYHGFLTNGILSDDLEGRTYD